MGLKNDSGYRQMSLQQGHLIKAPQAVERWVSGKRTTNLELTQWQMSSGHWHAPPGFLGLICSPLLLSYRWDSHPPATPMSFSSLLGTLYPSPASLLQRTGGEETWSGSPSSLFPMCPWAKLNPSCFRAFPFDSQGPFLLSVKPGSQQIKDFGFQNYCF